MQKTPVPSAKSGLQNDRRQRRRPPLVRLRHGGGCYVEEGMGRITIQLPSKRLISMKLNFILDYPCTPRWSSRSVQRRVCEVGVMGISPMFIFWEIRLKVLGTKELSIWRVSRPLLPEANRVSWITVSSNHSIAFRSYPGTQVMIDSNRSWHIRRLPQPLLVWPTRIRRHLQLALQSPLPWLLWRVF